MIKRSERGVRRLRTRMMMKGQIRGRRKRGEGAKRTVAAVEEDAADAVLLAAAQVEHLPPHRLEV